MHFNIHTHRKKKNELFILNSGTCASEKNPFSFGIHPWNASANHYDFESRNFYEIIKNPFCLAIGEIGLDRLKGPAMQIQIECFLKQLEISESYQLPVILHCVRAWDEMKKIHQALAPKQQWIFHGFNQPKILQELIKRNIKISIGPSILTNKYLQEAIQYVPCDFLFLETDDSSYEISEIYKFVSKLKNKSLESLEEQIEQNIKNTFPKWKIG